MALFFEPPTIDDVPPVLQAEPIPWPYGPAEYRLFGHFKNRARGRTLILKTDGTVAGPFDWPEQTVNVDPSLGDVFTEQGLAGIPYTSISRVFQGGHVYPINATEQAQLIAAGYGSGIHS